MLTLRRRIEVAGGAVPPTGATLGQRKAGGAKLAAVAAGNVVTESAKRSANRSVRLAESRIARTTVTPSTGDWGPVLPGLLVSDLEAEAARLAGLAPAVVRPRALAEELRVVEVVQVEHLGYQPGSQQLTARGSAPGGTSTVVPGRRCMTTLDRPR